MKHGARLTAGCLSLCVLACAGSKSASDAALDAAPDDAIGDASAERPALPRASVTPALGAKVYYIAEWSWAGARQDAQGAYVIDLPSGGLVTFSSVALAFEGVELLACDGGHDAGLGTLGLGRRPWWHRLAQGVRLINPLASAVAYADHSYIMGPTYLGAPLIELPFTAPTQTLGERSSPAVAYCRLFQSFTAVDSDPGAPLYRQTLRAVGTHRTSAVMPAFAFDLSTGLPGGAVLPLLVDADDRQPAYDVVLQRSPVRAAAEVNWLRAPADVAYDLLRALALTTRVTVRAR